MDLEFTNRRLSIDALLSQHAWFLDHQEAHRIAELYCEDGSLLGVGPDKVGRDAIASWGRDRNTNSHLKTRHVNTNLHFISASDNRVEAGSIIMLFRHEEDGLGAPQAKMICDYRDVIVLDGGRWLFLERRVVQAFVYGG